MVKIMVNIPRRKIYETMLEYEDALLELQILIYSEKHYQEYKTKYNQNTLSRLQETYIEIKALLQLFIEHKTYESNEDFETELKELCKDTKALTQYLQQQKVLPKKFLEILPILDAKLEVTELPSYEKTKDLFADLDVFNSYIPKILEYKRNEETKQLEK
jgi:type II secretory pathway component PulF